MTEPNDELEIDELEICDHGSWTADDEVATIDEDIEVVIWRCDVCGKRRIEIQLP